MPAMEPPEVQMDPELIKKYELEIEVTFLVHCFLLKRTLLYLFIFFKQGRQECAASGRRRRLIDYVYIFILNSRILIDTFHFFLI